MSDALPPEENPYAAPQSEPTEPSVGFPEEVRRRVLRPAIGLILVGVIEMLLQTLAIGIFAHRNATGRQEPAWGAFLIAVSAVGLCCGIILVAGGIRMLAIRNRTLCLAASVTAMLPFPCFGCCIFGAPSLIGLPIGIWSLVVLNDPDVKRAFGASWRAGFQPARLATRPRRRGTNAVTPGR